MREEIQNRIKKGREKRELVARELAVINAEVRTLEEILALLDKTQASTDEQRQVVLKPASASNINRVSRQWVQVLNGFVATHPTPFGIANVLNAAVGVGFSPTRGNVRSQMAAFVNRGWVERVDLGSFRMTEEGLKQAIEHGKSDVPKNLEDAAEGHEAGAKPWFDATDHDPMGPPKGSGHAG